MDSVENNQEDTESYYHLNELNIIGKTSTA